jgi:murein DD-endopeptidase MepM/ murein hydrolase activator NlpD
MQGVVLSLAAAFVSVPAADLPFPFQAPEAVESPEDMPLKLAEFDGCELTLEALSAPRPRPLWRDMPLPEAFENGHTEKSGEWVEYEQIPRRSERPESYTRYRYPVADALMVSGYDLDKPDALQRRGKMKAVGHGGVDLAAPVDSLVLMFSLENQVGDAEVLHAGWLFGETVVTRHTVLEGGHKHDYLVLFGHLDVVPPDVRRGRHLRDGDLVGFVGNSGSPDFVHLHLEIRRGRDDTDLWTVPGELLNAREYSVVTDPRNMLPLRLEPPRRASRCLLRPRAPALRHGLGDDLTLNVDLPVLAEDSVSGALKALHPWATGYVYSR